MAKKKGLGKGIGALLSDSGSSIESDRIVEIKLVDIEPKKGQPRKHFDDEKLVELSDSIKQNGVITPILVSEGENGYYTIIAGERRWRAAKMAGLKEIPAIVRNEEEQKFYELSLIENLQREDLNPVEEALGYHRLMMDYGLTQEETAARLSKNRSSIANSLRLLNLPKEILKNLELGEISVGHAKVLLSINDEKKQCELCRLVIENELSVRELEQQIKKSGQTKKTKSKTDLNVKLAFESFEKKVSDYLGTKVKIIDKNNKGKIQIDYYSAGDLERIVKIISEAEKIDL